MARKKGLPFVVQPRLKPIVERIGSEESGYIEIERRGYLTVAEKAIVQQSTTDDESMKNLLSLASRVSRETSRELASVMTDLTASERPEYLTPYEDEIYERMMELMSFQARLAIIQTSALIICRISDAWTVEQTMELHPDMLAGLANLYVEEDARSVEALEAAMKIEGGAEGK